MSRVKKKLLTTVLAVGMVLSLVGCGASETTSNEPVAETTEVTTEYGTEETTEVVEETVVEEQATETTETVEETTVEETTEEVAEETASVNTGIPTVFTDDDPKTSEVADMAEIFGITDYDMYMWKTEGSPIISIYETTENFELYQEAVLNGVAGAESFTTVSTVDGEKEVLRLVDESTNSYVYAYTLGSFTIKISADMNSIGANYDLQHIADLIRFE